MMNHAELLKLLLPPSSIDPNGQAISAEIGAEGNALDAALSSAIGLLREADPRMAVLLLSDWERVTGLPDACLAGAAQSTAERRAAVVTRITALGGQSKAYFIALAERLGYTVTISEFRPYRVNSQVNAPICGELWTLVWQVNAAINTVRRFTVTGAVNDPLASWGNAALECAITRLKPAHTKVIFAYT